MQPVAEDCNETERLSVAFIFSRLNQRNDPYRVIPTIAHQPACAYDDYKRIITHRFADGSRILEKNIRTQFKQLIIQPSQLATTRPSSLQQPLLTILDGLDEQLGEEE